MFNFSTLNTFRAFELHRVLPLFPQHAKILEIGAGTGEQARLLTQAGFDVMAIDLQQGDYTPHRVFAVMDYSGTRLPLEDASVDVVFSSNVLEHVPDLDVLHSEFRRVLKPGGMCVHLMPSAAWRWWTLLASPLDLPARVCSVWHKRQGQRWPQLLRAVVREGYITLVPHRHGERGNAFSELWLFSASWWNKTFHQLGWNVRHTAPAGLFYTGWMVLGTRLPLPFRARLAPVLGSACRVYVTQPR
jgi:SAM-dependent methyltransferase